MDFKGPIGRQQYYLHTQMDAYSRYPVVHVLKTTRMSELRKALDDTNRTHGRPEQVWSDGGAPYNSHEWKRWNKAWGTRARKTTPRHPPANGMVERFNRNLKLVLHAAYAAKQNPEEEVAKYVPAYRITPHTVTGVSPNKLMFNREISSKLPSTPTISQAMHHREARKRDKETKEQTKKTHDKKHRTRLVDIKEGDKVYRRNEKPTTTKGPWEPTPHVVTRTWHNQITGTRPDTGETTRDRSDWKLVKATPEHLWYPSTN